MALSKVSKGSMTVKAKLAEGGKVKETLHEEEATETSEIEVEGPCAVVKGMTFVRLSRNFQSMEIQVGIEFPVSVRPGSDEDLEGLKAWFDKIDKIVEDRVAAKIDDMERVLRDLKK